MSFNKNNGFTLIELLVVLTIVGLIVASAIPQYREYRSQAYDFRALNDLRMVALAQEAHYLKEEEYLECSSDTCTSLSGVPRLSEGVSIDVVVEDEDVFIATASHERGSGKVYTWNNEKGGIQP